MGKRLTNYQCPGCTAPLRYSIWSDRVECDYCNKMYTVREIEALYAVLEQTAEQEPAADLWGEDAEEMRAYTCSDCGAKLICRETTAAITCPYCGNHGVVPAQFAGTKRPDYVIPFRLSKEDAVDALRRSCKRRWLLPKEFGRKPCLETIQGVYVPFWLMDAQVDVDMTYDATNSSFTEYVNEKVETIEHYTVRRAAYVDFDRVPADGSYRMPDDYMDAIEPYNYEAMQPFSMGYLLGFLADRYDINQDLAFKRVKRRVENSAERMMRGTVSGYDDVAVKTRSVHVVKKHGAYALLPVWVLCAKYEGEEYLFAVNGQTGKTVGDFPVSPKKLKAWALALTGAATVGCAALVTTLLSMMF